MDKRALAAFLRSRRELIRPQDVGLPGGSRRRTPGLRREEVAQLAHISTDHYSRLEQARGRQPSRQVLHGIARALRLSDQERAHLFALAGEREHDRGRRPAREVAPATTALLDRLADLPALVVDDTCQVIAWNPMAAALLGDFSTLPHTDRNVLRRIFLPAPGGITGDAPLITDDQRLAANAVSFLRLATTRYPDDAELRALIAELLDGSPAFARMWHAQEVQVDHHARQVLHHPQVGPVELDFQILSVPDRDQQLVIFTADPGSNADQALRLLKVLGTQRMDVSG